MNVHAGNKNALEVEQEIPVLASDREDRSDELYQLEIAAIQDDENIDLDDALDDDNDNPVSHTLVDAAENSGSHQIRDTQELEGEELESKGPNGSNH